MPHPKLFGCWVQLC